MPSRKIKKKSTSTSTTTSHHAAANPNDVLSMKGAAAQQTQWPGNIAFYALCEDRFEEFNGHKFKSKERHAICLEIISEIHSKGGRFLKQNGRPMLQADIVRKIQDRMRQIGKPKIAVPSFISNNDVVFTTGGANHLYKGNPKFRALLDSKFEAYFPDLDFENPVNNVNNLLQIYEKPPHQIKILKEVISTVHNNGGVFRGQNLQEFDDDYEVEQKIHKRFKEMKCAALKAGKFEKKTFDAHLLPRTGVTSTRISVTVDGVSKVKSKKRRKHHRNINSDDDEDDENSFDSRILSDDDDSEEDSDDDEDESLRRQWEEQRQQKEEKKRRQAQSREERLKRRQQLPKIDKALPLKKRRHPAPKKLPQKPPPEETPNMTEYERLRIRNMKRNYERLTKLGLA